MSSERRALHRAINDVLRSLEEELQVYEGPAKRQSLDDLIQRLSSASAHMHQSTWGDDMNVAYVVRTKDAQILCERCVTSVQETLELSDAALEHLFCCAGSVVPRVLASLRESYRAHLHAFARDTSPA